MRILLAAGGTGGHINPALAIARFIKQRRPESEIVFAGGENGLETKLVPREGYRLEKIDIQGLSRKMSPKALKYNFKSIKKAAASLKRASEILDTVKPDVVVGTGGYASFPVLYAASKKRIPTAIHESNAFPGLTTRILAKRLDKIMISFEESARYFKNKNKVVLTGNPLREGMISLTKEQAKAALGLSGKKLIVSYWGSMGGKFMNEITADFIKLESESDLFCHIHASGAKDYERMLARLRKNGVDLTVNEHIDLREYIHDMPTVMAAADILLCRAGSMTLSELCATGTPAIIVPSPYVTENHQEKNARALERKGAAVVVLEKDCTARGLYELTLGILSDPERARSMSENARGMAILDGTERVYDVITGLLRKG